MSDIIIGGIKPKKNYKQEEMPLDWSIENNSIEGDGILGQLWAAIQSYAFYEGQVWYGCVEPKDYQKSLNTLKRVYELMKQIEAHNNE